MCLLLLQRWPLFVLTSCLGFLQGSWQKQQKCSCAFVFVMAKVTKTASFLPGKTWLLQNIRFCNKPPGYPEEPGNCMCDPSSRAVLAPAPCRQGCRLPSPGASNIPAVFFLPPGKAKAPNVPTRKIRSFVFNMNVALAKKMDWLVPVSPWSPSRGSGVAAALRDRCRWHVPTCRQRCFWRSSRALYWVRAGTPASSGLKGCGMLSSHFCWRANLVYLRVWDGF